MRILSSVLLLTLGGCSMLQPQPLPAPEPIIKTVTEYKTLEIYQPPLPKAIDLQDVEFFVINRNNLDEQIKKVEKILDGGFVVFALIPQDYEAMAANLQEIKRYILQSKDVILYYRQATTPSDADGDGDTDLEDYVARNKELTEKYKNK